MKQITRMTVPLLIWRGMSYHAMPCRRKQTSKQLVRSDTTGNTVTLSFAVTQCQLHDSPCVVYPSRHIVFRIYLSHCAPSVDADAGAGANAAADAGTGADTDADADDNQDTDADTDTDTDADARIPAIPTN